MVGVETEAGRLSRIEELVELVGQVGARTRVSPRGFGEVVSAMVVVELLLSNSRFSRAFSFSDAFNRTTSSGRIALKWLRQRW